MVHQHSAPADGRGAGTQGGWVYRLPEFQSARIAPLPHGIRKVFCHLGKPCSTPHATHRWLKVRQGPTIPATPGPQLPAAASIPTESGHARFVRHAKEM